MIKLSNRLLCMALLVENSQTVADIGTDHGFLPIYLNQIQKRKKIILTDISNNSLNKSRENVYFNTKNNLEIFDFRVGDGLSVLSDNEVETVVIAGMGGFLIAHILNENFNKSKKINRIIMQPRNGQGKLRWWLQSNGYEIENEKIVEEGKFICEIISAKYNFANSERISDLDSYKDLSIEEQLKYEFPEKILYENNKLGIELAKKHLRKEIYILNNLKNSKIEDVNKNQIQKIKINYYKNLIKNYI